MELPSKILEQIAFNTRPKVEEHMLIVMDKSTHEEHLAQPLQTNNIYIKNSCHVFNWLQRFFNVTNSINQFYFMKSITDEDGFIQFIIPPGVYEIESLNNEIKRSRFNEEHFTEAIYLFTIKPTFSTMESKLKTSPQGPTISFMFDDSIRDLLKFIAFTLFEKYNASPNPVDILSLDNIKFLCDIAHGIYFKGMVSRIFHNFTMDINPGYTYIEKFRGGV